MADNRVVIEVPSIRGNEFISSNRAAAGARLYVVAVRDAMRAALPDSRYKISDVAEWSGASNFKGFAFIFRDTTIGYEWLFCMGGQDTTSNTLTNWIGSGGTLGTYCKEQSATGTVSSANSAGSGFLVFMNHDYSTHTFAMGFTNTTELTYSAGDFTAPASSPYSALATFLPNSWSGRVPGLSLNNLELTNAYSQAQLIYDSSIGVWRYIRTNGSDLGAKAIALIGRIFPSYADGGLASATDLLRQGIFVCWLTDSTTLFGTNGTAPRAWFVRETGTVYTDGVLQNMLSDFTRANYVGGGGGVRPRKMQAGNGSVIKGYLDPAIIAEAFPYNDTGFRYKRLNYPDSDNPLIKEHGNLCFMYKANWPPFPTPDAGLLEV